MRPRPRRYLEAGRRLLTPGSSLTDRTVKGGIWVTLTNVSDRGLQLAMVVVVAGLIGPEEFGLMGVALLTLSALKRLSHVGIDAALVQRTEDDVDAYLNTAWCIQIARGVLLAGIGVGVGPWTATVLGEPRAALVVQVVSLGLVIQGLFNPGVVYLQKNLEFHKEFAYQLSSRLVYVVVAVSYAFAYQSVWALVFGQLASATTALIASYVVSDYRPWPSFDVAKARELLDYGKWIFGSSILVFLVNEGDDVFVGWFLGATSLGLYQLAYQLSNAPATEITHTISRVVFPTYAKLQHDIDALRTGYLSTLTLVTFVSVPAAVGIAVILPSFVAAFLGPAWRPMVVPGQILAAYGLLHSFRTAAVPLFRAVGRPDYDTKIRVLKLAVIVVLIYPAATAYGLTGVAFVIVANSLVANPVTHVLAMRLVDARLTELVGIVAYPAFGSVVMTACILALQRFVPFLAATMTFVASVVVGVVAYAGTMVVVERNSGYDIGRVLARVRSTLG